MRDLGTDTRGEGPFLIKSGKTVSIDVDQLVNAVLTVIRDNAA